MLDYSLMASYIEDDIVVEWSSILSCGSRQLISGRVVAVPHRPARHTGKWGLAARRGHGQRACGL